MTGPPGVVILLAAGLMLVHGTSALAGSPVSLEAARTLAENVLGTGTVKSLRASDDGTQLLIRWESATYGKAKDRVGTREMLYGEALLATNSILGPLTQVLRIRFTIVRAGRMLATGENRRGRGVSMLFSTELGGGPYVAPEPLRDRRQPVGGEAKEI